MGADFEPRKIILPKGASDARQEATLPKLDPFSLASDEFRLPHRRISDIQLTSNFVEMLSDLNAKELGKVRVNLGLYVGSYLKMLASQGLDGVVTAETYCPGMISSALTLVQDASKFFEGALIATNPRAAKAFHGDGFADAADKGGDALNRRIFDHLQRRNLPGELLISVNGNLGSPDESWVQISVGSINDRRIYPLYLGSVAPHLENQYKQEVLQERAAIAALHLTGLWIADTINKPAIRNRLHNPAYLKELAVVEQPFIDDMIGDVVRANKRAISIIGKHAQAIGDVGFMTAESVTGGNVGKMFGSSRGFGPYLSGIYVFYDEGFKETIGIGSHLLTPEKIGSKETVSTAAEQLLNRASHGTTTTIATSGEASRQQGMPDYFSVGLADRSNGQETHLSLTMDVTLTTDLPKSNGRKELTKRLAATAAALLATRALAKRNDDSSSELSDLADRLERFLLKFGDIHYG